MKFVLCTSEVKLALRASLVLRAALSQVAKDGCFMKKSEKMSFVGELVRKNSKNSVKMVTQFLDKHNINSV